RFRRGQREADRLEVAHLADEDDVGVLAQRRAQRLAEAERIAMHLALVHERALALVHELDRVLDRDDVIGLVVVDVVYHGGERRRDRKSTRLNSSHVKISYAVFCLKKKKKKHTEE